MGENRHRLDEISDSSSDTAPEPEEQRKDGNRSFGSDNGTNRAKEPIQGTPLTSTVENEGEDKIEEIEDSFNGDGQLWYKVKWAGEIKASWEPASFLQHVPNAAQFITAYHFENPQRPAASNGS
jgi:hypothetical protein